MRKVSGVSWADLEYPKKVSKVFSPVAVCRECLRFMHDVGRYWLLSMNRTPSGSEAPRHNEPWAVHGPYDSRKHELEVCNECRHLKFCPVNVCAFCKVVGSAKSRVRFWCYDHYTSTDYFCIRCARRQDKLNRQEMGVRKVKQITNKIERELKDGNKHKDDRATSGVPGEHAGGNQGRNA